MTSIEVSIIVPLRNEEQYIEQCIQSLLNQSYNKDKMEVIFVDGISEDKTSQIIQEYIKKYPNLIRLYNNPNRTVPFAMNIGIKNAQGKYVVRIDAHSEYAKDYIEQCIYYLEKTHADNVGGPMIADGKNTIQKVIAASYYSPFALGGGKFHDMDYEGYVDTVYLGAYKKETLMTIGLYDEKFTRNQDDELNYRLIKNNGKIFMTNKIKSTYFPRASYKKLFSQYFQYGEWKVAVIRKHGMPTRISHLIPAIFVLFLGIGFITSCFSPFIRNVYLGVLGIYLILDIYFSFANLHIKGVINRLRLMWVHLILHISYGCGFIKGCFLRR